MRKLLFLAILIVSVMAGYAQSMKMVVDSKGNLVGRYLRTKGNYYVVSVQDDFEVPIKGHKIVTYSAAAGQGCVSQKKAGTVNVRKTASTNGAIIGKMNYEEGDMPESYLCLGKVNGWYKIDFEGKTGYVRADLMEWDGLGEAGMIDDDIDDDSEKVVFNGTIGSNAVEIIIEVGSDMIPDGYGFFSSPCEGILEMLNSGQTYFLQGLRHRLPYSLDMKDGKGNIVGNLFLCPEEDYYEAIFTEAKSEKEIRGKLKEQE